MKRATKIDAEVTSYERRTSNIILREARAYRHGSPDAAARMLELLAVARQQGADVDAAVAAVLDRVLTGMAKSRPVSAATLEGRENLRRRAERDVREYKPTKRALHREINLTGPAHPGPSRDSLASMTWSLAIALSHGADIRVAVERLFTKVWRVGR